jgi:hypothetical protein
LAYPPPSAGTPLGGGVATGGVPTFGGGGPGGAPLPVGAYPPAAPSTVPVPVPVQAVAVAPDPYAGQPAYPVPVQRSPGQSQAPVTGIPAPQGFPGYGLPTVVGPAAPRRGRWQAIVMVMLLVAVLGQGVFLVVLQRQVSAADRHITQLRSDAAKNQAGLNTRVKALEQQAAQSLDSAAVAEAVLPSVFRVDAGNFSGTAFALGKSAPSGGGTDLLTNFHVVSSVYNKGGRDATLTHDNQRFAVKITKVDQTNDLALLHSNQNFTRLAVNSGTIESGTPIVVIGAPLGLSQSVTTGVVSAVRNDFPGEAGKTFIQFSAPINPGNSGGPVVNAQKQVVGIASAKANDAEGIGLAIPIGVGCTFTASC